MKRRFLSASVYSLLAILVWNALSLFCKTQTDGFTVARIQTDLPYDAKWATPSPSPSLKEEMRAIFSQPFHYLGRGGQCFVFASADERYVIKFFKHRFYKPYELLLHIPLPLYLDRIRKRKMDKIRLKMDRDCTSYQIAFEEIPEETGLLYLHLHPKEDFDCTVSITDKLGITHPIALNKMAFLLQKKAEPIPAYLKRKIREGNHHDAQQAIRDVLKTLVLCAQKGIFDEDPGIHRNFGFREGRPMFIDVGRFKKNTERTEARFYQQDLKETTLRFHSFLQSHYPELIHTLDEELEAIPVD